MIQLGMLDKAKFWKKADDDLGDFSDLGDFGLDDKPSGMGSDTHGDDFGDLGSGLGSSSPSGGPATGLQGSMPAQREEVMPTQASQDLGDQFGIDNTPSPPAQQQNPQHLSPSPSPAPHAAPAQHAPFQGPDLQDLFKDIEIIHAKLDTIKASLDSVNQRLATLERMAGNEGNKRYTW